MVHISAGQLTLDRAPTSSVAGPVPQDRRIWENGAHALMTSEEKNKANCHLRLINVKLVSRRSREK